MKIGIAIKNYFYRKNFSRPKDFYHINWEMFKIRVPNIILRILYLIFFEFITTLLFIIYYFTLPFRIINEWCECKS